MRSSVGVGECEVVDKGKRQGNLNWEGEKEWKRERCKIAKNIKIQEMINVLRK